jgi:RNA-directed DNA polymerase
VLNAIYEQDFVGFSYGFRPGRSQHHALDALAVGLRQKRVHWVLDAEIRGFFDSVDHVWLMKFVEHRIADRRVVQMIQRWLAAGVLEDGTWTRSETGTVQGGSISPLLANLYLHYVFDLWLQKWRKTQARDEMIVVRYADDFIIGFQRIEDAERFLVELRKRFATFGLELHAVKTRLLAFGERAWRAWRNGQGAKPGTFDFLGLTHISATSRRGSFVLLRVTMRKRWQSKLREVKTELQCRLLDSIPEHGQYLRSVVEGHYRYYGVPGNGPRLGAFRRRVIWLWRGMLVRRSQKHRITWDRMWRHADRWLPLPRICHSWPNERDVMTRGKSRMQ